jgi:hypothetical protein
MPKMRVRAYAREAVGNQRHHASPSQKYALDIVRLNGVGSRAAGVYPSRLDRYAIFGSGVCSPCAGVVAEVVGDLPDLEPGHMDRCNLAGNYVMIKHDDADISVILAHLMRNSLTVQPGDRVRAGQLLGKVGNSGNTSEPHLHIHAKRGGTSVIDGVGVPIRFDGRWLARNSVVRRRASD